MVDAVVVMIVLVILFGVALATLTVVGTVKAARVVAAKVERGEASARRAVENATLKARSVTRPGVQGEVPAVRLALRTSLESTRQVLESGLPHDGQLTESLQLLDRLGAHAAQLDAELRMLERELDAARISARLPELRERAHRITHSAESLRWAAQDRMRRFSDDELARLSQECQQEAGALRHWDSSPPPASTTPVDEAAAIADAHRPSAEEALGLADSWARLADRLRRPGPDTSPNGRPYAG